MIHEINNNNEDSKDEKERQVGLDVFADQHPLVPEQVPCPDQDRTPNVRPRKCGHKKLYERDARKARRDTDQGPDTRDQAPDQDNPDTPFFALFFHLLNVFEIDMKYPGEPVHQWTAAFPGDPVGDGCTDCAPQTRIQTGQWNEGWRDAMTLDQHPACKGQNDLAGRNAGRILENHQAEHTEPAELVEDGLQGREDRLFE